MSELRFDPLQRRWVIIAAGREARPTDFGPLPDTEIETVCPFCEGNEDQTPPEIFADRDEGGSPDSPGWRVRVIPNKFPALGEGGQVELRTVGLYGAMAGVGAHEVIIETPEHSIGLADLNEGQILLVFKTFRRRILALQQDERFRYCILFKNHGAASGASLSHAHTQLVALPIIPETVTTEVAAAGIYFEKEKRCLMCDLIDRDLAARERIIRDDADFLSVTPFASRFPFECRVIPVDHNSAFETISNETLGRLTAAMKDTLLRLKDGLKDPPYNIILHTVPNYGSSPGRSKDTEMLEMSYHWYFEIVPRLTKLGGFELGTGMNINQMPPEEAARFLREVEV